MPEKREIETKASELLDRALSRYAGEPLTGLEGRTLARLRVEQEAAASRFFKRARVMRWLASATAGTVAVAASLLIGIQIGQRRSDAAWQQRVATAAVWNSVKPAGTVSVPPAPPVTTLAGAPRKSPHRTTTLTKRAAQFPTPVPMTREERALARLAEDDPALLASLAKTMQSPISNEAATQDQQAGPPK